MGSPPPPNAVFQADPGRTGLGIIPRRLTPIQEAAHPPILASTTRRKPIPSCTCRETHLGDHGPQRFPPKTIPSALGLEGFQGPTKILELTPPKNFFCWLHPKKKKKKNLNEISMTCNHLQTNSSLAVDIFYSLCDASLFEHGQEYGPTASKEAPPGPVGACAQPCLGLNGVSAAELGTCPFSGRVLH